jgi:hypothetical protein
MKFRCTVIMAIFLALSAGLQAQTADAQVHSRGTRTQIIAEIPNAAPITRNVEIMEIQGTISSVTASVHGGDQYSANHVYITIGDVTLRFPANSPVASSLFDLIRIAMDDNLPVMARYEQDSDGNLDIEFVQLAARRGR